MPLTNYFEYYYWTSLSETDYFCTRIYVNSLNQISLYIANQDVFWELLICK